MLAAAGVLKASDLPGYVAETQQTQNPNDQVLDQRVNLCLGLPAADYLVWNLGTNFTKGAVSINSSVEVAPSLAQAKAKLAAYMSTKAPGCFKQVMTATLAAFHVTLNSLTATPLSLDVSGADAVFGYQIGAVISMNGRVARYRGFQLYALVGQLEPSLSGVATDAVLPPLGQLRALLATSVARIHTADAGSQL